MTRVTYFLNVSISARLEGTPDTSLGGAAWALSERTQHKDWDPAQWFAVALVFVTIIRAPYGTRRYFVTVRSTLPCNILKFLSLGAFNMRNLRRRFSKSS